MHRMPEPSEHVLPVRVYLEDTDAQGFVYHANYLRFFERARSEILDAAGYPMREIAEGLQVNSRGSKTKSLRGSAKKGYKSTGGSRSMSAMTVGYQETWTVDSPNELPVFTRDDIMGTSASIAAWASATKEPMSRPRTLHCTTTRRRCHSRVTVDGPSMCRTSARRSSRVNRSSVMMRSTVCTALTVCKVENTR